MYIMSQYIVGIKKCIQNWLKGLNCYKMEIKTNIKFQRQTLLQLRYFADFKETKFNAKRI